MADKKIPSSDFRATYSSLSEPVDVTVLGRVIGRWYPLGWIPDVETPLLISGYKVEIERLKRELAARLTTKVGDNVHAPAKAVRAGDGLMFPKTGRKEK